MRILLFALLFLISASATGQVMEEPDYGERPQWIETIDPAEPDPELDDQPLQYLLNNSQTRFEEDFAQMHVETITLLQNAQGLAMLGTLAINWQPDRQNLQINTLVLIRDGEAIDLLNSGQRFMVLRRENNLENAVLDGVLTAVVQPEGMAVGDRIRLAYTITSEPEGIDFKHEEMIAYEEDSDFGRIYKSYSWPESLGIRWEASDAMEEPHVERRDGRLHLVVDQEKLELPDIPENAPLRYSWPTTLQFSQYDDWSEASALLAPHYAEARRLQPDSPLHGEVARIADAHADPRDRALAALQLVQERVRYVALSMGDAGWIPSSADETWRRRFGDCKGKTALLLALFDELGIDAEPVLVSTTFGEAIGEWMPQILLFDHVIVRAEIDGRTYWLDGTRQGDTDLTLSTPYGVGLPVTEPGTTLARIEPVPPALPTMDGMITIDATRGFSEPSPMTMRIAFRGDMANAMRTMIGQLGEQAVIDLMRESFAEYPDEGEIDDVAFGAPDNGAQVLEFSGRINLEWEQQEGSSRSRLALEDDVLDGDKDFTRENADHAEIPFALEFPIYVEARSIVLLPDDGEGFSIEGEDIDRIVAGAHYLRTTRLDGNRLEQVNSMKQLTNEISAADARASEDALAELLDNTTYLIAPAGYDYSEIEQREILASEPGTVEEYRSRGYLLMQEGSSDEAVADFDAAIDLDPDNAQTHANRALALLNANRLEEAEQGLRDALAIDGVSIVAHRGLALLRLAQARPADAIAAIDRAIELRPGMPYDLFVRANAHEQLGDFDTALAELETILETEPDNSLAIGRSIRLLRHLDRQSDALAMADRMIALDESDASNYLPKASLLRDAGREDEARTLFDRALSLAEAEQTDDAEEALRKDRLAAEILAEAGQPQEAIAQLENALQSDPENVDLLNSLCWMRMQTNIGIERALAQCEEGLALESDRPDVIDSLGWVKVRLGRYEEAIAEFDRALASAPLLAASLYGRGLARQRLGMADEAAEDLALARQSSFDVDREFARYGLSAESPESGGE